MSIISSAYLREYFDSKITGFQIPCNLQADIAISEVNRALRGCFRGEFDKIAKNYKHAYSAIALVTFDVCFLNSLNRLNGKTWPAIDELNANKRPAEQKDGCECRKHISYETSFENQIMLNDNQP